MTFYEIRPYISPCGPSLRMFKIFPEYFVVTFESFLKVTGEAGDRQGWRKVE